MNTYNLLIIKIFDLIIEMENYFPNIGTINFKKLQITHDTLYSITKPKASYLINRMIEIIFGNLKNLTITDATANVGGNTIRFGLEFKSVNSVEINHDTYNILKNNISIYKFNNTTVYNNDYNLIYELLKQDIVFIDPPWGGINYHNKMQLDLYLSGQPLVKIVNNLQKFAKGVVIKVPFNFNFIDFTKNLKGFRIYNISKIYGFFIIVLL